MRTAILLLTLVAVLVSAGQSPATIKVLSFNKLAPTWADPNIYPSSCSNLLVIPARTQRTVAWMQNNDMSQYDAIAWQETEAIDNGPIKAALGNGFSFFQVNHADSYWAGYITVDPPFAPNGVAIAINQMKYDRCVYVDKPLGTGNHGAIAICRHKALGRWFRFASVHFDSDQGGRRGKEANTLADYFALESSHSNYVDVIAGDINSDTDTGVINQRFTSAGYVDIGHALGSTSSTHPWSTAYNSNSQWAIIDHVLVKGTGSTPTAYKVFDSDLYTTYPGTANENTRICLQLEYMGSDHFPVSGTFTATA